MKLLTEEELESLSESIKKKWNNGSAAEYMAINFAVVEVYSKLTSTNKQSTSASQIADEMSRALATGACERPEEIHDLLDKWDRQLRTL